MFGLFRVFKATIDKWVKFNKGNFSTVFKIMPFKSLVHWYNIDNLI